VGIIAIERDLVLNFVEPNGALSLLICRIFIYDSWPHLRISVGWLGRLCELFRILPDQQFCQQWAIQTLHLP